MKVLMTVDACGGLWTPIMELATALAEHDVEFGLASMGGGLTAEQQAEASRRENVRLFESTHRLEWMNDPWRDVARAGRWLMELRDRFQPDVVHLNGYAHAPLGWHRPVLLTAQSCAISWWKAVRGGAAPADWNRYRGIVTAGLRAAKAIVTPSQAMADSLRENYGRQRRVVVIPCGRDGSLIRPGPKHPFVLGAGGVWDAGAGIAALDEAAAALPWRVYVTSASDGPRTRSAPWHPGVPETGGNHELRHARPLGDLPQSSLGLWLSRSDIFALPARYAPFSVSALEAALAECALVLGDIPGLRETWDGVAVFVDPADPSALRQAIHELIKDPRRRRAMAQDARSRALTHTPQRMARAYHALYAELAADGSPADGRLEAQAVASRTGPHAVRLASARGEEISSCAS